MDPAHVVFVDRTGLLSVLDRTHPDHSAARILWEMECDAGSSLVTTNYAALAAAIELQARYGVEGVRALHELVLPAMHVEWCSRRDHAMAAAALLARDDADADLCQHTDEQMRIRLRIDRLLSLE
jgi:hypothetical protein